MVNATSVKSNFSKFLDGYRTVRQNQRGQDKDNYMLWPIKDEFCGEISYKDRANNKIVTKKAHFGSLGVLAGKKLKGEITDINIASEDKGKITSNINYCLDFALNPELVPANDTRAKLAEEAFSGMYLLGMTENKTFVNKLYNGLNKSIYRSKNQKVENTIEGLFNWFGLNNTDWFGLNKLKLTNKAQYQTLNQTMENILKN
jgi:hypothetical protein